MIGASINRSGVSLLVFSAIAGISSEIIVGCKKPATNPDQTEKARADDVCADRNAAALHRNEVRQFDPDRKDHHWGKRKLKRDQ
jgi:hypothetical protein